MRNFLKAAFAPCPTVSGIWALLAAAAAFKVAELAGLLNPPGAVRMGFYMAVTMAAIAVALLQ